MQIARFIWLICFRIFLLIIFEWLQRVTINNIRCILHVGVIGLILSLLIIINPRRSHDSYDMVDLWNIFPKYILITVKDDKE